MSLAAFFVVQVRLDTGSLLVRQEDDAQGNGERVSHILFPEKDILI